MYGLILVEPKGGLPKVDREFHVMQGDFYAKPGAKGEPYTLDMEKGLAETTQRSSRSSKGWRCRGR